MAEAYQPNTERLNFGDHFALVSKENHVEIYECVQNVASGDKKTMYELIASIALHESEDAEATCSEILRLRDPAVHNSCDETRRQMQKIRENDPDWK